MALTRWRGNEKNGVQRFSFVALFGVQRFSFVALFRIQLRLSRYKTFSNSVYPCLYKILVVVKKNGQKNSHKFIAGMSKYQEYRNSWLVIKDVAPSHC